MRIAIVSDLYLGTTFGADTARRPQVLERSLVQHTPAKAVTRGRSISRRVWSAANLGGKRGTLTGAAIGRAGPLPGDVEAWWLPGGARLTNTGSWIYEDVFLDGTRPETNPYWPGRVVLLVDEGPPRVTDALPGLELEPPVR